MQKFNVEKFINNYPTKYKEGFTDAEVNEMVKKFPIINIEKFNSTLTGITCMKINDDILTYHCDLITALKCGLENRDMFPHEWD
jgi:hypothetical protein